MSGYLEVKYPFKSSLGLNPFKTWKRQWCILRPCPTRAGGGSLAVYHSEAGAAAGCIDLAPGSTVRRSKSRSRPHAFAIFSTEDLKPRVLLAAHTLHEAQLWMEKIKGLLSGKGTDTLLKDSYFITLNASELSHKVGLCEVAGVLSLCPRGLTLSQQSPQCGLFLPWRNIAEVALDATGDDKVCVLNVDSGFPSGPGQLTLSSPSAADLVSLVRQAARAMSGERARATRHLSCSEGDLRTKTDTKEDDAADDRRTSWYSGPSDVSLDDTDLVMFKECRRVPPSAPLSRCAAAPHLAPHAALAALRHDDHSMSDRRSLASVASGIYEEIPEAPPDTEPDTETGGAGRDVVDAPASVLEDNAAVSSLAEPTYESVSECVSAGGRAPPPPPLPPRLPFGTTKLGESWNSRMNKPAALSSSTYVPSPSLACPAELSSSPPSCVTGGVTRHSSLGSLPRCCSVSSATSTRSDGYHTKTLPKPEKNKSFSVFRKRLKSDSLVPAAAKCDNTDTKKKKFDFAPTRDIFKTFKSLKVGRKTKTKTTPGNLSKIGETKSCEHLDDTAHVSTKRCSKSVECLEYSDDDVADLSLECGGLDASLSLPQDIVDLILRGRRGQLAEIRMKQLAEDHYMPMSPIVAPPPPIEQHYIVMSPRTNIA